MLFRIYGRIQFNYRKCSVFKKGNIRRKEWSRPLFWRKCGNGVFCCFFCPLGSICLDWEWDLTFIRLIPCSIFYGMNSSLRISGNVNPVLCAFKRKPVLDDVRRRVWSIAFGYGLAEFFWRVNFISACGFLAVNLNQPAVGAIVGIESIQRRLIYFFDSKILGNSLRRRKFRRCLWLFKLVQYFYDRLNGYFLLDIIQLIFIPDISSKIERRINLMVSIDLL